MAATVETRAEPKKRNFTFLAQEPRALGKNFSNWNAKKLRAHLNLAVHAITVLRYVWR